MTHARHLLGIVVGAALALSSVPALATPASAGSPGVSVQTTSSSPLVQVTEISGPSSSAGPLFPGDSIDNMAKLTNVGGSAWTSLAVEAVASGPLASALSLNIVACTSPWQNSFCPGNQVPLASVSSLGSAYDAAQGVAVAPLGSLWLSEEVTLSATADNSLQGQTSGLTIAYGLSPLTPITTTTTSPPPTTTTSTPTPPVVTTSTPVPRSVVVPTTKVPGPKPTTTAVPGPKPKPTTTTVPGPKPTTTTVPGPKPTTTTVPGPKPTTTTVAPTTTTSSTTSTTVPPVTTTSAPGPRSHHKVVPKPSSKPHRTPRTTPSTTTPKHHHSTVPKRHKKGATGPVVDRRPPTTTPHTAPTTTPNQPLTTVPQHHAVVPTHHSRGVIGSITHAVVAVAPTWVAHQVTHAAKWVAHRFVAAYHWMSDELGIWVNLNFPSLFSGKYGVGTVIVSLLVGVVGLGLFALFILFGYRRARRDRSEKALERLRQETIKQRQEAKNDKKAA